jgi:probable phosphoglycerate mutase
MARLIIWRHGRTAWNAVARVQGQTDVDLDDTGVAQAAEAAPRLAAYQPELIVSSDMRRTTRTADALAALTGLPVEYDVRLRERHFGPWQGLTMDEVRARFPDDFARFGTAAALTDPAIETREDMAKRIGPAFRDAADRVGADGTAVLVLHGGTARVGCGVLLGWPAEAWHTLGGLWNCRHAELRRTERRGWHLVSHNLP